MKHSMEKVTEAYKNLIVLTTENYQSHTGLLVVRKIRTPSMGFQNVSQKTLYKCICRCENQQFLTQKRSMTMTADAELFSGHKISSGSLHSADPAPIASTAAPPPARLQQTHAEAMRGEEQRPAEPWLTGKTCGVRIRDAQTALAPCPLAVSDRPLARAPVRGFLRSPRPTAPRALARPRRQRCKPLGLWGLRRQVGGWVSILAAGAGGAGGGCCSPPPSQVPLATGFYLLLCPAVVLFFAYVVELLCWICPSISIMIYILFFLIVLSLGSIKLGVSGHVGVCGHPCPCTPLLINVSYLSFYSPISARKTQIRSHNEMHQISHHPVDFISTVVKVVYRE